MRRPVSAVLAALLALAPFPARAQVGRLTLEAPLAPAPSASASIAAPGAAAFSPMSPSALAPALTPAFSAPAAQPIPFQTVPAAAPVAAVVPALSVVRRASNDETFNPESLGRLFDGLPAAPDLESLATVKTPDAPAAWRPSSFLLKPAAAAVNAWRLSRHEKRLERRGADERVTTEEHGLGQTLSESHAALAEGRLQDALAELTRMFKGRDANRWYRANPGHQPYQDKGREYIRFIERAVKLAYERAHGRARDARLIAEARASARMGSLLGGEWRRTQIQERDSAHCAHHALFNAISASVGFADFVSVIGFVERARELLNVRAEDATGKSGAELAAIHARLGYKLGVDVGEGMDTPSIKRWAQLLGMSFESRGPPRGDAQWSALLRGKGEVMLSLRMFHERFPHGPDERKIHGHDYRVLNHEVYLLGAFDSPSRGVRLYMVQDSGSGSTDFYTAEELSAVAAEIQLVSSPRPVALP